MPHCIVEYSKELESVVDPATLLQSVYAGALESELFTPVDIKVRAIAFDHFTSGSAEQGFVHVTTKLLSGRSLELRTKLSNLILARLNVLFECPISLTVEIMEIEKESYAKCVK